MIARMEVMYSRVAIGKKSCASSIKHLVELDPVKLVHRDDRVDLIGSVNLALYVFR